MTLHLLANLKKDKFNISQYLMVFIQEVTY